MFQCGDQVLYGIHGVCKIVDIERKKLSSKVSEYYVLEPLDQSSARYYIPTQNEAAVAKLQPILTPEELHKILHGAATQQDAWIEDENQRKQLYSNLITGADRAALVCMVHAIHKQKRLQAAVGRRLHLCDENFLRDAEKLLNSEFSLVLNIKPEDVGPYVKNILDAE